VKASQEGLHYGGRRGHGEKTPARERKGILKILRNEAGMYMKTKGRLSAVEGKAGMLLITKEIVSKSANLIEKKRGYPESYSSEA
jgi:hypothetical protein